MQRFTRLVLGIGFCVCVTFAPIASAQTASPSGSALPTAAELSDRCAKASGGAAWSKLSTMVLNGTMEIPAAHVTGKVDLYAKAPNRALRIVTIADRQYVMKNGYDGQVGWELGPPKGLRRLVAAELEQARQEAIFDSDVRLKELFPDMQVVEKSKVGDRDAYVALMRTRPSAKASKYYFDAQTGLRIAEESENPAPNGQLEKTMTYYEDYRAVGGVQIPFRIRFTSASVNFTITIENARVNVAVDDAMFAMPAAETLQAETSQAQTSGSAASEVVDEGDIDGNLYTNKVFGLAYKFPEGWTPHGDKTKKHIMEVGKGAVEGDSNLEKSAYQNAEKRTQMLLTVFKYPLGTPADDNDGVTVMSEDVSFAPGIKTGKDYLLIMAKGLSASKVPMEFQGEPTELTAGGQTFYKQNVLLTVHSKQVYEAIVTTIVKEHALAFIFIGMSEEGRASLVKTLDTVHFENSRREPSTALKAAAQ
jgi:hypothetical protein